MGEAGEARWGSEDINRLSRTLWGRVSVANVAGALLAAISGILTSANIPSEQQFGVVDIVALIGYLGVSLPVAKWWGGRCMRGATRWVREERPPTEAEQRRTLAQPWLLAAECMVAWAGAAVVWSILTGISHDAGYTARVALSIALGGLTTCGLSYLLAEWTLRPLAALALAGAVPERAVGPGVRARLVLSWAVGADVFLLMIGLTFLGRPAGRPPSAAAVWFIVGAGLVAGTLVLAVAAKSLVVPLLELRRSVERVRRDDLDVHLAVNDGGEIGLLQAGFNQMVAGLRDRRTLEDLFGRHVGVDVARQAVGQGVALGGERRQAAIVFVDIIGSTRLAQSRPPEAVVELLNRFFGSIVRVVAAEGGWVNKFEGDGALCVFGAPVAAEDCAARALRAARTLRRELLALSAVIPELDAAVGVSAGAVVAGNVGAEQRYEYTVIGAPVNEAARLTEEAKHRLGRVLASEEAVSRSGEEAALWLVADEMTLRGYTEPTLVYQPAEVVAAPKVPRAGAQRLG